MVKRIYSGLFVTLFGLAIIISSFIWEYFLLIYGIPLFIIGIIIIFHGNEDKIEEVKHKKIKKEGKI